MDRPFLQLPRRYDAQALAAEVRALPAEAWVSHPTNYEGNDAVLLVTPGGDSTHGFAGPMAPTRWLGDCPVIADAMADLGGVWGRCRLMGLEPGAVVPMHVDTNYYWRTHVRIHVPILTTPEVLFTCGGETVHMAAGTVWTFDSFRPHRVVNGGGDRRVHLVIDTVGSDAIWALIDAARNGAAAQGARDAGAPPAPPLRFEQENVPKVMSPWELRAHIAYIESHAPAGPKVEEIFRRLDRFASAWAGIWAEHGADDAGIPAYHDAIRATQVDLKAIGGGSIVLPINNLPLYGVVTALIFRMAIPEPRAMQAA